MHTSTKRLSGKSTSSGCRHLAWAFTKPNQITQMLNVSTFFSALLAMMLTPRSTWPVTPAWTPFMFYLTCKFKPRITFSLNTMKLMSCPETSVFPCLKEFCGSLVVPIFHSYLTPRCPPVPIHHTEYTILLLIQCWKAAIFLKSITACLARRIKTRFHRLTMCVQGFQSFSFLLIDETFSF